MTREQLDLLFKSLRWSVPQLMKCEDRKAELELALSGDVGSPKFGFVGGIAIPLYRNKQIALQEELDFMVIERDYHLHIVRTAAKYLKNIKSDDDLNILELYYWRGYTPSMISNIKEYRCDKSVMYKRIKKIVGDLC
ncbi:MAG: hypothetical protein ACK5L6_14015 [Anaerorhabdus sp.]|uniref:hypothetical protein n=1 Tax=Anaerorhabdus sp. TaxID=1872524 RepID=UPI003A8BD401